MAPIGAMGAFFYLCFLFIAKYHSFRTPLSPLHP